MGRLVLLVALAGCRGASLPSCTIIETERIKACERAYVACEGIDSAWKACAGDLRICLPECR